MVNHSPWLSRRGQTPYDVLVKASRIETGPEVHHGGVFYPLGSEGNDWSTGRFHRRDFDDFSFVVVGRPFTHLFAVFKYPECWSSSLF
jgi:hypothetical protein